MSWLTAELRRQPNIQILEKAWNESSAAKNLRQQTTPGGDVKKHTDLVKGWSQKLEHHVWGNEYAGRGITKDTSTDDINEPDTKATMAGRKNSYDEFSSANRRKTPETMVNINKGKKHSLLTQKKGGR